MQEGNVLDLQRIRPVDASYVFSQIQNIDRENGNDRQLGTAIDPQTSRHLAVGLTSDQAKTLLMNNAKTGVSQEQLNRFVQLFESGGKVRTLSLTQDIADGDLVFMPTPETINNLELEVPAMATCRVYLVLLPDEDDLREGGDQVHSTIVTNASDQIFDLSVKEAQILFDLMNKNPELQIPDAFNQMLNSLEANETVDQVEDVDDGYEPFDEDDDSGFYDDLDGYQPEIIKDDGANVDESEPIQPGINQEDLNDPFNDTADFEKIAQDDQLVDSDEADDINQESNSDFIKKIQTELRVDRIGMRSFDSDIQVPAETQKIIDRANESLDLTERQIQYQAVNEYNREKQRLISENQQLVDVEKGLPEIVKAYQRIELTNNNNLQTVKDRVEKQRRVLLDGVASQKQAYLDQAIEDLKRNFESIGALEFVEKPLAKYEMDLKAQVDRQREQAIKRLDQQREELLVNLNQRVGPKAEAKMTDVLNKSMQRLIDVYRDVSLQADRDIDNRNFMMSRLDQFGYRQSPTASPVGEVVPESQSSNLYEQSSQSVEASQISSVSASMLDSMSAVSSTSTAVSEADSMSTAIVTEVAIHSQSESESIRDSLLSGQPRPSEESTSSSSVVNPESETFDPNRYEETKSESHEDEKHEDHAEDDDYADEEYEDDDDLDYEDDNEDDFDDDEEYEEDEEDEKPKKRFFGLFGKKKK